jgi:hypothetical protein
MTEQQILNILAEANVTEIDVNFETEEGAMTMPVVLYTTENIQEAKRPAVGDDMFVIGYVKGLETPICVNKTEETLPVYISVGQDNAWENILIFPSLQEMVTE